MPTSKKTEVKQQDSTNTTATSSASAGASQLSNATDAAPIDSIRIHFDPRSFEIPPVHVHIVSSAQIQSSLNQRTLGSAVIDGNTIGNTQRRAFFENYAKTHSYGPPNPKYFETTLLPGLLNGIFPDFNREVLVNNSAEYEKNQPGPQGFVMRDYSYSAPGGESSSYSSPAKQ